ncbi:MAG: hypothetical protein E4H14_18540 [Candidatus Thorarchaeota archaeon]|nr:MAG: hypothetical protein E4H14_18540 [Candidatus Thorarchaeota archaeon]
MSDQLELMVKYLIHLQFYSEEEDVLFSRDIRQKLSIPGIGEVIADFENEFQQHIDFIRKKQFRAFLEALARKIDFEVEPILVDFNRNVCELGSQNLTDELSANFLIGPIRSYLQSREFETCIYEIKREAIIRIGNDEAKAFVNERISDFFSRNDSTVSMLHNLALLKFITFLYGPKETQLRVVRVFDQYCEELASKLTGQ